VTTRRHGTGGTGGLRLAVGTIAVLTLIAIGLLVRALSDEGEMPPEPRRAADTTEPSADRFAGPAPPVRERPDAPAEPSPPVSPRPAAPPPDPGVGEPESSRPAAREREPGGSIVVHVRHADGTLPGRPVRVGIVKGWWPDGATASANSSPFARRSIDARGDARFAGLDPGDYEVRVVEPETASYFDFHPRADVRIESERDEREVTLRVPRFSAVGGRMVDESGEPVVGSRVRLGCRAPAGFFSLHGQAAQDGTFRMDAVPYHPEATYRITVSHREFPAGLDREVRLAPGEDRDLGDLVLGGRAGGVRGRIVEADGEPGVRLRVGVHAPLGDSSRPTPAPVVSSDQGVFELRGLIPGSYELEVPARQIDPPVRFDVPPGSRVVDVGDVVVEETWSIRGRVTDGEDQPLQNVKVEVESGSARTRTDRDGRFELRTTSEGPFDLRVRATSRRGVILGTTLEDVPADGREIDVRLVPSGVALVFVDATTGDRVKWSRLTVRHRQGDDERWRYAGSGGTRLDDRPYRILDVVPGPLQVRADVPGYEPAEIEDVLPGDVGRAEHVIRVPLRRIRGG